MCTFKLELQKSRFVEQKLQHLFRYCVLVHFVTDYLNRIKAAPKSKELEIQNIKDLFVQDITHFLCGLCSQHSIIPGNGRIRLAALTYFNVFCRAIMPQCVTGIVILLNLIVSDVTPLIKQSTDSKLATVALRCLEFLVIDNETSLYESIALLDSFPAQAAFDKLRKVQVAVKYGGKVFSLRQEIEYFLKVDVRKLEGLSAIREHVSISL